MHFERSLIKISIDILQTINDVRVRVRDERTREWGMDRVQLEQKIINKLVFDHWWNVECFNSFSWFTTFDLSRVSIESINNNNDGYIIIDNSASHYTQSLNRLRFIAAVKVNSVTFVNKNCNNQKATVLTTSDRSTGQK